MAVGRMIGKLTALIEQKAKNLQTFCIGFSLGAQLCGFIGKEHKLTGILGLDPAGPIFRHNSMENQLNKNDAGAVHVFHSSTRFLGIKKPIGHVDFYINGGEIQPACRYDYLEMPFELTFCSHAYTGSVLEIAENNTRLCATNTYCPIKEADDIDYVDFSKLAKERSTVRDHKHQVYV